MQRLFDIHHHDTQTLEQELSAKGSRHLADLKSKLAARRARKLAEVKRKQDEEEQQRLISEQNRQMQQGGHAEEEESDVAHVPKVQYSQSNEEQALQKEQVNCPLCTIYAEEVDIKQLLWCSLTIKPSLEFTIFFNLNHY